MKIIFLISVAVLFFAQIDFCSAGGGEMKSSLTRSLNILQTLSWTSDPSPSYGNKDSLKFAFAMTTMKLLMASNVLLAMNILHMDIQAAVTEKTSFHASNNKSLTSKIDS